MIRIKVFTSLNVDKLLNFFFLNSDTFEDLLKKKNKSFVETEEGKKIVIRESEVSKNYFPYNFF